MSCTWLVQVVKRFPTVSVFSGVLGLELGLSKPKPQDVVSMWQPRVIKPVAYALSSVSCVRQRNVN